MKKNLIITASDSKFGDFLINHWLKSLLDNVNIDNTDIVILDYGLNNSQKEKLLSKNVKVIGCKRDGFVINIRYRDTLDFLNRIDYGQVLFCDSGDIIFQEDISHLFLENKDKFRVVREGLKSLINEYSFLKKSFSKDFEKEIKKTIFNERIINAGFIIGSAENFKKLCSCVFKNIKNLNVFGPDQVIVNYYLYKNGFVELDKKFNYLPTTAVNRFKIKNGVFFDEDNLIIPVVHNAGGNSFFRSIKNFGYGENYNELDLKVYKSLRALYLMTPFFNKISKSFFKRKNRLLRVR